MAEIIWLHLKFSMKKQESGGLVQNFRSKQHHGQQHLSRTLKVFVGLAVELEVGLQVGLVAAQLADVVGADVQQQMMLMMTESFSKLSAAFSEGKNEPKTDWPKSHG